MLRGWTNKILSQTGNGGLFWMLVKVFKDQETNNQLNEEYL